MQKNNYINMGRGDRKTKKGKIFRGSYGNSRLKKPLKTEEDIKKKLTKEKETKEK